MQVFLAFTSGHHKVKKWVNSRICPVVDIARVWYTMRKQAGLAQLVEQLICNQ